MIVGNRSPISRVIGQVRLLRYAARLTFRAGLTTTVLIVVLIIGQASVVAVTGLSQRWLVDSAFAGGVAGVIAAVALGAAAFALNAAGGRVQSNMLLYLTTRVSIAVTEDVLRMSAAIPTVAHLERPDHLDRLERLRRGGAALAWLPWTVLGAVAALLSLVASVVLLALVDPWLSALALLAVPPLLVSRRANAVIQNAHDAATELNRQEQRLHELCTQPEPAKELFITGGATWLSRRADELWRAALVRERTARLQAIGWHSVGWLVFAGGFVVALLVVDRLIRHGQATLGDAVLVFSVTTQLQAQIRQAVEYAGRLAEGGHIGDHFWWLRDYARAQRRDGQPPPPMLTGGIVLDRVTFRYPGAETDVLRDLSVRLAPGTTVALVGDNGVGKTTLVKLLTGMYEPTAGDILVDGMRLRELELPAWQARISGVFQDFARFQFTVGETIGVGHLPHLHDADAISAAAVRGGADELIAAYPRGLRTQLGRGYGGPEPSPGQWQRLALARGLMRQSPLLLVLDEPTAALDPQAEYDLFSRFVEQARDATANGSITLLVSHRMATVRMADVIVVLADGVVSETGSHTELMQAGGRYAEMFRLQERGFAAEGADQTG